MSSVNPVTAWRRLLAMSNDSRPKMLAMAVGVAAAASIAVSVAFVLLESRIEANRAAETQARLAAMLERMPGLSGLLAGSQADTLQTLVVDLDSGLPVDPVSATEADETFTPLSDEIDIAGIGQRPDRAEIHLLKDGNRLELVILPMHAAGYQSTIRAMLALRGDLNTVAGLVVTEQGETPGLGANIANAAWQRQWSGKSLVSADGDRRLTVVRGKARDEFEVDGITGATRSGAAMTDMIAFWTGPHGYGKLFDALRAGAY